MSDRFILVERKDPNPSSLRGYFYVAKIHKKTRELMNITAGCRTWASFKEARDHYHGKSCLMGGVKWHNNRTGLLYWNGNRKLRDQARKDSLNTLTRLQRACRPFLKKKNTKHHK